MGYKSDVQATRITAPTTSVVVAPSIRLRGIIVSSSGGGAGTVELKTGSATGTTLFIADVPSGDIINFSFPEDGIVFPQGIYVSTFTSVAAVTLLTDKFSGPGLISQ